MAESGQNREPPGFDAKGELNTTASAMLVRLSQNDEFVLMLRGLQMKQGKREDELLHRRQRLVQKHEQRRTEVMAG
ncbi:hypothetical protein HK104_002264 [Borealophlyctis nickersoniae]|nr:hypothetical protein HK104_002264 [Borealophlyctis nickersoniae]